MSEMNIDSLKIEIASSSEKAEKSIDKLIGSLGNLKSALTGMDKGATDAKMAVDALLPLRDIKAGNLGKIVSHLERLSKINLSNLDSVKSLKSLVNLNPKDTGLNNFVNGLTRLGNASKDFNPQKIHQLMSSLKGASAISGDMSSVTQLVKSVNSIVRSTDKAKNAAVVFPELSRLLKDFFDSIKDIQISDNTVRVAESLAQITKNGRGANTSLTNMKKTLSSSVPLAKGFTTVVEGLSDALKKIGGTALTGLKNLFAQISGLNKSTSNVSSLNISLRNLLTTVIGFRGITGVFNWLKDSVKSGADLTEIDHIVESVFGEDMIGYVEDWASSALESFGIAGTAAKKYAGTMSAMFQASNVAIKDSNQMAMDLVKLAGDLSAFYNIDTETAYNKLKSGMAGMVRPLRDLGIDLSVATLKEYALSQGIEKSYSAMTQGEKMMLRYKYLMEQTALQQGDFAKEYMQRDKCLVA